jgi:DNA-binding NtrC family response regulator
VSTSEKKGRIFILDDDELIAEMLARSLRKEGYEVQAETDTTDIVKKIESWHPDVTMLDIRLPDISGMQVLKELKERQVDAEVVMLTADDTAETAVECMKLGAADYLTKPFNIEEVQIVLHNLMEKERLLKEVTYLRRVSSELVQKDIIGISLAVNQLKSQMEKMAQAGVSTVLITGESGTGKEVLARYFHHMKYPDGHAPFIAVNCTALPESLIESELFGHEKGAFTDAKAEKKGVFELADGGSILLDEIADMKQDLQTRLLRVLEERTVRRIGGRKDIPVDVTVIASTNRDIKSAMDAGEFRMDLFYRLNTFSVQMPALRERGEDIPALAGHFLRHFTSRYNKRTPRAFSPEAEEVLQSYQWPGNVRELRNVVERIAVLESAEVITPDHLPQEIIKPVEIMGQRPSPDARQTSMSLKEIERGMIEEALRKTDYNMTRAAKLLNISYDTMRYRTKKYGIEVP